MPKSKLNVELVRRYSRWLVVQRYAPYTRYNYTRSVNKFLIFLGRRAFLDVTHLDVQEFLAACAAAGSSPKRIRGELYALRVFFDFLNLGGLVKWVPPRIVKLRPLQRHIPRVLTRTEILTVMRVTRTRHERALLEVLYGTGCRTGELRNMRIEDIDFCNRRILVHGKAGSRFLMFTTKVADTLRSYLGERRTGFVFVEQKPPQRIRPQRTPYGQWQCHWKVYDERGVRVLTKSGFVAARERLNYREAVKRFSELAKGDCLLRPLGFRPLSDAAIQNAVQRIGLRAGIKINPYSFRHTFATHLLDNGASVRIVQELLGHRSIRSTQVYLHVSKKQVQREFDRCHPRAS